MASKNKHLYKYGASNEGRSSVHAFPKYFKVKESEIPEEYRLDVGLGFRHEKDPERYRRESISYLENRIRDLRGEWFDARNDEDRKVASSHD